MNEPGFASRVRHGVQLEEQLILEAEDFKVEKRRAFFLPLLDTLCHDSQQLRDLIASGARLQTIIFHLLESKNLDEDLFERDFAQQRHETQQSYRNFYHQRPYLRCEARFATRKKGQEGK